VDPGTPAGSPEGEDPRLPGRRVLRPANSGSSPVPACFRVRPLTAVTQLQYSQRASGRLFQRRRLLGRMPSKRHATERSGPSRVLTAGAIPTDVIG
jgi:hypothetical protein